MIISSNGKRVTCISSSWESCRCQLVMSPDQTESYCEFGFETGSNCMVGVCTENCVLSNCYAGKSDKKAWMYYSAQQKYNGSLYHAYGLRYSSPCRIGLSINEKGELYFYHNGKKLDKAYDLDKTERSFTLPRDGDVIIK
eukprot:TRINITY_DN1910_c0_g1_i1.p1 TRINITY_DN1910_c0_g1~~TRINITY_DN1910_c0_g1_i1.p1  ORF type:complete len:140 (-),score=13.07 TRINITY_DN1910_c0_g1_i1:236-655(-)